MKAVIVGGGKSLYFLCRRFASRGDDVTVINRDPAECAQLARQLRATVLCGDGSDTGILAQAGARGADVVLAITGNDQDNLVICQLAALQYSVPRVVALANDPDNTRVFEALGVAAFSTTEIIGSLIEQRAALAQITNLLPVAEGRVNVTEIALAADSPAAGRDLKSLDLPENTLVAVVVRSGECLVPRGASQLQARDRVVLVTLPENHGPAIRALTGEAP